MGGNKMVQCIKCGFNYNVKKKVDEDNYLCPKCTYIVKLRAKYAAERNK